MKQTDIPIWERYTLTIEEASKYFRIACKCQYKNVQK